MNGVAAVTALALLEYMILGALVGRARVHQNSLEALIVFVPALWLFSDYVNNPVAIALGLIFVAGRIIYAAGYVRDPAKRGAGAGITFVVNGVLVLGSLVGALIRAL